MPYLTKSDKLKLHRFTVECPDIHTPGELNYLLTFIAQAYIDTNGKNYAAINAVVGALECAKLEFYRRLAAPYEDQKITENGDVY